MFTGIVAAACPLTAVDRDAEVHRIAVALEPHLMIDVAIGASISVDGVCLTVTRILPAGVEFDVVPGTLERTTLATVARGAAVNIERALRGTDEVGGHDVSGHVDVRATVHSIEPAGDSRHVRFSLPASHARYVFEKGFVALNGVSLTVSDADRAAAEFGVWLIPETLRRTNLGELVVGSTVNVEVHRGTQVLVDTVTDAVNAFLARLESGESASPERLIEGLRGLV